MRNYVAKLKENSKKGFSLVELIIVIAIMAILVGIVASQVIPYMEKSRKSKDQQQLSSCTTAVVSAIAQSDEAVKTFDSDLDTAETNLADLEELLGAKQADIVKKFKSKAYKGVTAIYVSYDDGDGKAAVASGKGQVVTYVGTSGTKPTDKNLEAISE